MKDRSELLSELDPTIFRCSRCKEFFPVELSHTWSTYTGKICKLCFTTLVFKMIDVEHPPNIRVEHVSQNKTNPDILNVDMSVTLPNPIEVNFVV